PGRRPGRSARRAPSRPPRTPALPTWGADVAEATPLGDGTVLLRVDARGVATVTLNRPEVNNAYDEALLRGVHEAVDAALATVRSPSPVRCVVLRGAGRHFQAGADLTWLDAVRG